MAKRQRRYYKADFRGTLYVGGMTQTTTMAGSLLLIGQGNAAARWANCMTWARRRC